jgi:hypothetical protein
VLGGDARNAELTAVLTAAGVLATEAMYYRLAGQQAGVAVPSVLDVDPGGGVVAGGYLVMSECAGSPWPELLPQPARRARLRQLVLRPLARTLDEWSAHR